MENNLDRFWVSFKQWYLYELPQNNLIKEQFISYDEHDDAKPYLDIDFNHYYKLNFGVEYDGILEKDETITVKSLKMLTELTYSEFIKDRYAFTVDVNKRLVKFNIPLKLRNGVLISVGHKSSNEIKYIYNYEQLERKIKYSEELIKRIIGIVNNRIDFEKNPKREFNWWESFKNIDFEIVDECITENCIENWDGFIAKIHKINWE